MHPYVASELTRLASRWPGISFEDAGQRWSISKWSLPPGWNQAATRLWVPCPAAYPQMPPDNFYVDATLRLADGREPGSTSIAMLEAGIQVRNFSYHVEIGEWSPERGDSLETFLFGVQKRLAEGS